MQDLHIAIDYQAIALERQVKIDYLESELKKAQKEAYKWESKYQDLLDKIESGELKPVKSKEEKRGEREQKQKEKAERMLLGVNCNGRKLASASEAIGSYSDFKRVQKWLEDQGGMVGVRDATIWTVGVCLGVRVSDLVRIKFYHLFDQNKEWRERIPVVEKKTSKINNALITEAIKEAMNKYIEVWFPEGFELHDWVFTGKYSTEHITEKALYKHFVKAQEALGIEEHLGTHAMRKSFVKIIECTYDASINEKTMTVIQTLLNHDSATTTSKYLGVMKAQCDGARKAVSDFVLGKWDGDELVLPKTVSNNELYDLIQQVRDEIINEIK